MGQKLIQKLYYSYKEQEDAHPLPTPLKDSLQLIADFFASNSGHKLCLVFPSKVFVAQWLSIPIVLFFIENDFIQYREEISESYRRYKLREKLKLNGKAIVEWNGIRNNSVAFKAGREPDTAIFTIATTQSIKLQRTEQTRQLSTLRKVKSALPGEIITPTDKLLEINTYGNKEFIKNKVCLVTKYKSFDDSIDNVVMNLATLPDYFQAGKINENGTVDIDSPLLLANNISNLTLYSVANPITRIIIDGFSAIQERESDFSDIDVKNIPTILITDLSEIGNFEHIGNYGFEFFNFAKENLNLDLQSGNSPFHAFNKKLKKYASFNLVKEICANNELETIVRKIHSIEKDDSNNDLNMLRLYLIQFTNFISRICHSPSAEEIIALNQKLNVMDNLFQQSRMWLGDSHKPIEESISLLKSVIKKLAIQPSEKSERLTTLVNQHNYDYIICPTEEEAQALRNSFPANTQTRIISIADVNDDLLTDKSLKALITGWAKSNNINRILSSFLFSELTVMFYQFENKYYNSLQRRNRKFNENIKSTIDKKGIRPFDDYAKSKGFDDLYSDEGVAETTSEGSFDILDFELKLNDVQYSKYTAKGSLIDTIKAKRVDFENNLFVYSSESHRFIEINELIEKRGENANLRRKKLDALNPGDVIALINTDRDILAELVERNINKQDLTVVKQWTNLWKSLLKEYFSSIGNDFKKLVGDLRKHGCKKHEVTIRTWLQDENRIGPDDDSDLISIALMTNSELLYDNIGKVREAIRKMTGWRMKASDFISDNIKARIHEYADSSAINKRIPVEGLGNIVVIKAIEISAVWENIDVRYVNRLLQKEIV